MPRAVLFDLDDTLLRDQEDVDAAFVSVTAAIDRQVGATEGTVAAAVRAHARRVWRAGPHHPIALRIGISSTEALAADFTGGHPILDGLAAWIPSYRAEAWLSALEGFGAGDRAGELAARYPRRRRSRYRLFPDALSVIGELRARGLRLAVVTNGPPDLQREKLDMTGLLKAVDAVAISGEVGAGKPQREIFDVALRALDVPAEDAVMIGDSMERDIQGAEAAGMIAIWRAGPGDVTSTPLRPSVRSLSEILAHPAIERP